MIETSLALLQEILPTYLSRKMGAEPSEIKKNSSTPTQAEWTLGEGSGKVTVTATQLTDDKIILNFIQNDDVMAIRVDFAAMEVWFPMEASKVTPNFLAIFSAYIDKRLDTQGDFWNSQIKKKASSEPLTNNHDKTTPQVKPIVPEVVASVSLQQSPKPVSRPPDMPVFDDEYGLKDFCGLVSQAPYFGIGDRDLNPPGLPREPLMKPFHDPLAGDIAGGGMHPSRDHPYFGQRPGNTSRSGVPPGARYDDPYGEDNLEDMGMGLPGNLRRGQFGGPPGGSPFGGGMF